jgi:predicted RND superfamily exporter protein
LLDRTLDALARLCLRHSKSIAIIAFLIGLAAIGIASRLKLDPEVLNLIPQNSREVNDFRRILRETGTADNHVVVLHLPEGRDVRDYDALIEDLAKGYAASPRIEDVNYRLPDPLDFVETFLPRALLFLTPGELSAVEEKLTDDAIRQSVIRNRALLQTPQSLVIKQLIQFDPFNFAPIFLKRFQAAGGGLRIDVESGYFLSADRSMLLIIARPKRPALEVSFARELLAEGAVIEARALKNQQMKVPAGTPMPRIEHTGAYQIAVSDAKLMRRHVLVTVAAPVAGVLALFLYLFRRAASLLYAAAPTALVLAVTFAIAALVFGTLSPVSAGFAPLLAGTGAGFIIIFYSRYLDERSHGATMPHALIATIQATIPAITIAAVTTAATFYAFLATDFRGMAELGLLTGTGILLFLLGVAFVVPALLVLCEPRDAKRAPPPLLHSFGTAKLIDVAARSPRATIALWTALIVAGAVAATQIRFRDDIESLRADRNEGVINQERVAAKFGQALDMVMYVIEGRTLEEVLEKTGVAAQELDPLVARRVIDSYQAITTFVPLQRQQRDVMARLASGRDDAFSIARINRTFRGALAENGFRPESYNRYLELFAQSLAPKEPMSLDQLDNADLNRLTSRFVKKTRAGWASVIYVDPARPREVPPGLLQIAARHPGDTLTGLSLVRTTLRRMVKEDAIRATAVGFVIVLFMMIIAFRSFRMAAFSFAPVLAGTAGTAGVMVLLGVELNFMNVFVPLMIMSWGTSCAVYMREDETGKGAVMAALATIAGYASLALSAYPGLRSIGYASIFGIGLSGLAAITLLPAILVLGNGRRNESDHSAGH